VSNVILAIAGVGLLVWVGSTLLGDAWLRRSRRATLADRLAPYQPTPVAEDAERWLRAQR
jgi:hypothetical protein